MMSLKSCTGSARITRLRLPRRSRVIQRTLMRNLRPKRVGSNSPARKGLRRNRKRRSRNRLRVKRKRSRNLRLSKRWLRLHKQPNRQRAAKRLKLKSLWLLRSQRDSTRIGRMRSKGIGSALKRSSVKESWRLKRKRRQARKWRSKRSCRKKCLSRCKISRLV